MTTPTPAGAPWILCLLLSPALLVAHLGYRLLTVAFVYLAVVCSWAALPHSEVLP